LTLRLSLRFVADDAVMEPGTLVWIPVAPGDDRTPPGKGLDKAFLPAVVVSADKKCAEVTVDGSSMTRQLPATDLRQRFTRQDGQTSADNTSLVHMNDASLLENLRVRHEQDEIYTYTASVLLAVNPFKEIDHLYTQEQCERYRGKHIGALPPHPYAIADTAYRTLSREDRNQALLISGESGAGKTETAKIVMKYLAYASGAQTELATRIQERVLMAQPILESFGNAATLRNSNSSRFGKYSRVFFGETGGLSDAGVTTYLLESSRVVVHGDRERTYHVFYEMLAGLDEKTLGEFHLSRDSRPQLLYGAAEPAEGSKDVQDVRNFERLRDSLRTIGLDDVAIQASMKVLSGLMHLGDVPVDQGDRLGVATPAKSPTKDDGDTESHVEVNEESVQYAAEMLGLDAEELCGTLKFKIVTVKGRNSRHKVPRSASQFRQSLHSFVKTLYKRLFERTVQSINNSFKELQQSTGQGNVCDSADEDMRRHIGILDIYGFERLQQNSFEQLCINLANERLQQYFVVNVLEAEQGVYNREGLPWSAVALPDSEPVVTSIAQVFWNLDDFSTRMVKGFDGATDEKFCEKIVDEATKGAKPSKVLKRLKGQNSRRISHAPAPNEGFVIQHYAGEVSYTTRGWIDKNNDRLLAECESLICCSTNPLVKDLGEEDGTSNPFKSISKKYSQDLESLLQMLSSCNLHYIRCFKPNHLQQPQLFNERLVLDQITQSGTIELVRIMHDGYPNRCPFDEITTRFKDLLPDGFDRYGMRTFIEALMLVYEVPKEDWALGMSRLFLKAGQLRMLESMRTEGARPDPEKLARIVKDIVRKRWRRAGEAVRFCTWFPKFVASIRVTRAAKAMACAAAVTARLAPQLEAAKLRVAQRRLAARRKLAAAFRATRLCIVLFRATKAARLRRLANGLFRSWKLTVSCRPWLSVVRDRLSLARKLREEEDLKQKEELEVERLREMAERAAAEAQRLMEEAARRSGQRTPFPSPVKDNSVINASIRPLSEVMSTPQEYSEQNWPDPCPLKLSARDAEMKASSIDADAATSISALYDIGDSVSQAIPSTAVTANSEQVQDLVREMMKNQLKELQDVWQKKQENMMGMIEQLQEKNLRLEHEVAENTCERRSSVAPTTPVKGSQVDGSGTPSDTSKLSLIDLDEGPSSPIITPLRSTTRKSKAARMSMSHSSRRLSLISLSGGREPRMSVSGSQRADHTIGDAVVADNKNINTQRKWWAEQRSFLMEELYPDGSPSFAAKASRQSLVGGSSATASAAMSQARKREDGDADFRPRDLNSELSDAQGITESGSMSTAPSAEGRELRKHRMSVGSKLRQPKSYSWK